MACMRLSSTVLMYELPSSRAPGRRPRRRPRLGQPHAHESLSCGEGSSPSSPSPPRALTVTARTSILYWTPAYKPCIHLLACLA